MKNTELFTPSSIGKRLSISTAAVNVALIKLGFVTLEDEGLYALTKNGEQYGRRIILKKKNVVRIKWREAVFPLVLKQSEKVEDPRNEMRLLKRSRYAYVLELENSCYYVGSATSLKKRLKEHFTKAPRIKWLIKNPIVRVAHTEKLLGDLYESYELEDRLSLGLAKSLGVDRVRGGKLSGNPLSAPRSWFELIEPFAPVSPEGFDAWNDEQLEKFIL